MDKNDFRLRGERGKNKRKTAIMSRGTARSRNWPAALYVSLFDLASAGRRAERQAGVGEGVAAQAFDAASLGLSGDRISRIAAGVSGIGTDG